MWIPVQATPMQKQGKEIRRRHTGGERACQSAFPWAFPGVWHRPQGSAPAPALALQWTHPWLEIARGESNVETRKNWEVRNRAENLP